MTTGRVAGKRCLITGAARGLGLAAAERLLQEGAKVLLTDRDTATGTAQCERLKAAGHAVAFLGHDVTDPAQWTAAFDAMQAQFGGIDVLVNNAGVGAFAPIDAMSFEDWRRTLSVNLDGVFLGVQQAVPRMQAQGGSIINVASIEGLVGHPHLPAYNASKGGVRLLTKSTAIHCARSGWKIRVNSLCPGFAATELVSNALVALGAEAAQAATAATLADIPMGRFAEAQEIAHCVLFLASDESSYMTGADLVVDGGMTA